MNKEKIISYIEDLEDKANQSDEYLIERTEAHIKVKHLQSVIDKAIEFTEKEIYYCLSSGDNIYHYLDKLLEILRSKE